MTRTARLLPVALSIGAIVSLAGCGQETDPSSAPAPSTSSTEDPSMTTEDPGDAASGTASAPHVQAAIQDLVEREGMSAEQVSVAELSEVTWNDGSLGCPEPGMNYTQALVPGQLLRLEADGQMYEYHAADGEKFSYCADPKPPVPGDSSSASSDT